MELGFEFASIVTVAICPLARLLYSLISCDLTFEGSTHLLANQRYGKKNIIYLLLCIGY